VAHLHEITLFVTKFLQSAIDGVVDLSKFFPLNR